MRRRVLGSQSWKIEVLDEADSHPRLPSKHELIKACLFSNTGCFICAICFHEPDSTEISLGIDVESERPLGHCLGQKMLGDRFISCSYLLSTQIHYYKQRTGHRYMITNSAQTV